MIQTFSEWLFHNNHREIINICSLSLFFDQRILCRQLEYAAIWVGEYCVCIIYTEFEIISWEQQGVDHKWAKVTWMQIFATPWLHPDRFSSSPWNSSAGQLLGEVPVPLLHGSFQPRIKPQVSPHCRYIPLPREPPSGSP